MSLVLSWLVLCLVVALRFKLILFIQLLIPLVFSIQLRSKLPRYLLAALQHHSHLIYS